MAVVTHARGGSRALVEYTGRAQLARVWSANGRKWNTSYVIDTLSTDYSDVRPATEADLKRFKFTLKPGDVLG